MKKVVNFVDYDDEPISEFGWRIDAKDKENCYVIFMKNGEEYHRIILNYMKLAKQRY